MTTKIFDNRFRTFKILLSWRFPRKAAFWDNFPVCPQGPAPSKAKSLFLLSSRRLNCGTNWRCPAVQMGGVPRDLPFFKAWPGRQSDTNGGRIAGGVLPALLSQVVRVGVPNQYPITVEYPPEYDISCRAYVREVSISGWREGVGDYQGAKYRKKK